MNKLKIKSDLQSPHKVIRTTDGLKVKQPKEQIIIRYTN
jgi:hypothetical protein